MNRKIKQYLGIGINALAFACFLFMVSTGILMKYLLPPGSHSKAIMQLGRHDWGDIHFWLAVSFFSLLAVHLILHWNWIVMTLKGRTRSFRSNRFRLGLAGFVVVLILAAIPLLQPVTQREGGGGEHENEQEDNGSRGEHEMKMWPGND